MVVAKLIDLLKKEKTVLKKLDSWMEVQPNRSTRSLGLKTRLNHGKCHSNLGIETGP